MEKLSFTHNYLNLRNPEENDELLFKGEVKQ